MGLLEEKCTQKKVAATTVFRAPDRSVQAPEVVGEADQRPFAQYFLFATPAEPAKAHRFLYDAEDRLDGVVALCVEI
jgi:hypothetical protein